MLDVLPSAFYGCRLASALHDVLCSNACPVQLLGVALAEQSDPASLTHECKPILRDAEIGVCILEGSMCGVVLDGMDKVIKRRSSMIDSDDEEIISI